METDRLEQLERSIQALLARIEAQKADLGSLLRDRGPALMLPAKSSNAPAPIETTRRAVDLR